MREESRARAGQWTVDSGRWAVDGEQWTVAAHVVGRVGSEASNGGMRMDVGCTVHCALCTAAASATIHVHGATVVE